MRRLHPVHSSLSVNSTHSPYMAVHGNHIVHTGFLCVSLYCVMAKLGMCKLVRTNLVLGESTCPQLVMY